LLALPADAAVPRRPRLRAGDLKPLRQAARQVQLPATITTLLVQARAWCAQQSVTVSDRRWRKLVALLLRIPLIVTDDSGIVTGHSGDRDRCHG